MITKELTHTELILTFEYNQTKANIYWNGGKTVSYELWYKNYPAAKTFALLASGNDLKPSPMHNIDGIETMLSLLSFMSVKQWDTDPEYFINHMPEHLQWLETRDCNEIYVHLSDFEEKGSDYHAEAVKFFKETIKTQF